MWTTLFSTLLSLALYASLLSGCALGWTTSEWQSVVSSVLGVQVLKSEVIPDASDLCDNCLGTGKVGDGTVFVTCGACDGTGRRKREKPQEKKDEEVLTDKSASTFRGCTQFT